MAYWPEPSKAVLDNVVGVQVAHAIRLLEAASDGERKQIALDTRPFHQFCYSGLPPADHDHYAGNYRGSNHCCLKTYRVQVGAPGPFGGFVAVPNVGVEPPYVETELQVVSKEIREAIEFSSSLPPLERLLHVIAASARFLAEFLRVHPYANGNGHAARYAFWAVCLHLGLYPKSFPVHERPNGFADNLNAWRAGDPGPLERYLLLTLR